MYPNQRNQKEPTILDRQLFQLVACPCPLRVLGSNPTLPRPGNHAGPHEALVPLQIQETGPIQDPQNEGLHRLVLCVVSPGHDPPVVVIPAAPHREAVTTEENEVIPATANVVDATIASVHCPQITNPLWDPIS